jgi:D-alanine--D-alanine ligase
MAKIAFTFNLKPNVALETLKYQSSLDGDSEDTVNRLARLIEENGHSVIKVPVDDDIYDRLKKLRNEIDLVFNIAEGLPTNARESQIPLICEILKIPYTHSSPTVHAVKLNKTFTKLLVKGDGVRVPESFLITNGNPYPKDIKYPVIIKPNAEGSSTGIFNKNVVSNLAALKKRVKEMRQEGFVDDLLIEEYIDGREFTVAVLGNEDPKVLPIIEQKFDFLPKGYHKVAGFELKWIYEDNLKDLTKAYDCPAKLSKKLEKEIRDTSLRVYKLLNVRECARIDYRLSDKGKLYFLEINTLPALTPAENVISYFPIAAHAAGYSMKQLVGEIINLAMKRYNIKS